MRFLRKFGLLLVGGVLSVLGAVLLVTQPVSFGWTAYAPLSSNTFVPLWPTPGIVAGVVLLIVGFVTIAGWVGFRLGRARSQSSSS
ncbi:hypothetical protein [Protaetiibacter mangrovi]|uniref:Uncharacterized protein n=1 Tax=Protaetiibacter mangrovi TaxID=2970926 RepID=A0ABT1ZIK6_9MICO|nr:hypothetical protein [Protaetiibacter mangrovi]MCS0500517.1 hypothetical protein [Protaetiibacter mangrovi]TPX02479.1 hypothetical protein FJ656_22145 [Schumannella luteola]